MVQKAQGEKREGIVVIVPTKGVRVGIPMGIQTGGKPLHQVAIPQPLKIWQQSGIKTHGALAADHPVARIDIPGTGSPALRGLAIPPTSSSVAGAEARRALRDHDSMIVNRHDIEVLCRPL